jgi:iron-sulfur cluster repair protein YtfE (RIC family)
MKPSEIRDCVLAEHEDLRKELSKLEVLAECVLRHQDAEQALRALLLALSATLEKHLAMEEELLLPAIAEVDAWGPVRAEQMAEDHQAQRATIARLNDMGRRAESASLASEAMALGKALLADMRREETDLLHPDLLRDDVIAIGQFLG